MNFRRESLWRSGFVRRRVYWLLLLLAFKNWEQIANKDFALGQATIGHYYENGIGVKKNVKIAAYWYEKAAIMKIK